MAALYASEIDNCLIQVNAPEFPILDGSAQIYVENIMRVGIEEQSAEKDYYIIRNKVEITDEESGSSIIALPDDHFSISTMVLFNSPILNYQYACLEDMKSFSEEIAAARTFVFVKEIEPLLKNNLIKGGDLDNAIVIYDHKMEQSEFDRIADLVGVSHKNADELGFINNRPLVFNNEPARHKLLDILGDIALIGKPIKGRIIATRPGHKINNLFARAIRKEVKRQEIQVPFYDPNKEPVMDVNRIKGLLPHRYPMLLVDKIIEIGKNHMVEDPSSYSTYFMKIDNVKFRQKVVPGDTAIFHVSFMTEMRRGCAYMKGYVFVGDKITTEAEFMAQITKNK